MDHISFLNKYYGAVSWVYDVTRKYYLFGRDLMLEKISNNNHASIVEVGAGTGRNLEFIYKNDKYRKASLIAIEPCEPMIKEIRKRNIDIDVVAALGESFILRDKNGDCYKADCIFLSYCLSMCEDPKKVIDNCLNNLSEGGTLYIVDFGPFKKMPKIASKLFLKYLNSFRVHPEKLESIVGPSITKKGFFDYYFIAEIKKERS